MTIVIFLQKIILRYYNMSSSRANQKRNLSSDNSFEMGENKGTMKKLVTKTDPKSVKTEPR